MGARVVDYRPELGVLVIGYIDGTDLENAAFADPRPSSGPRTQCRRLHPARGSSGDFDMFARQAGLPRDRAGRRATASSTATSTTTTAFGGSGARSPLGPHATVPCNNDLLAAQLRRRRRRGSG